MLALLKTSEGSLQICTVPVPGKPISEREYVYHPVRPMMEPMQIIAPAAVTPICSLNRCVIPNVLIGDRQK